MNYVNLFKPFLYNIYKCVIERCMPKEFI